MSRIVVRILRASTTVAGEDAQGNPIMSAAPDPIPVKRVGSLPAFAPRGSSESATTSGPRVVTGGTLYLPPGTAILPTDRFEIDGDSSWMVDGEAGTWQSSRSGVGRGVEVAVRRADGWASASA